MSKRKWFGETNAADAVDSFTRRAGIRRGLRRAEIVLAWERLAGADLAQFTYAKRFADGVLYVDVSDAETALHLQYERTKFLKQFARLGFTEVKNIRFAPASLPKREPAPAPTPDAQADPALVSRLLEGIVKAQLPEELAEAAREAAQSYARNQARKEAQGAKPCIICGALHMGHDRPLTLQDEAKLAAGRRVPGETLRRLCISCRMHALSARTDRLSRSLVLGTVGTPGEATPEELLVARYLAANYLQEMLERLASEVVQYPAARYQLEALANRYRELLTPAGEPPAPISALSEHVRRMLET